MAYGDGRPSLGAAKLNSVATKFGNGGRRIDLLRQLAYDCGLTNEQARSFGKLTATATWEKLLLAHGLEFEPRIEIANSKATTASQESAHQINLLDWVDFGQLIAVSLASVGCAVLVLSLWSRINPLNLFPPIRINIQIGATK
jgi:Translation elongation factors (GTPases)